MLRIKAISHNGEEAIEFSDKDYNISIQMDSEVLSMIQSMEDGSTSPEGREYRTFAVVRPKNDDDQIHLSEWAKS